MNNVGGIMTLLPLLGLALIVAAVVAIVIYLVKVAVGASGKAELNRRLEAAENERSAAAQKQADENSRILGELKAIREKAAADPSGLLAYLDQRIAHYQNKAEKDEAEG